MTLVLRAAATAALAFAAVDAQAALLLTDANNVPGVAITPAYSPLAPGGAVGTATIGTGIDFTFGNVEGIFNDGDSRAFCGINASNECDLLTDVDGRIVVPGTTTQGLTNYILVEAGAASAGALTLEVFDINGVPLATAPIQAPVGNRGRFTAEISRGAFDIASFRIFGDDTYGVNDITIETPIGNDTPVPAPAALALFGLGVGLLGLRRRG